MTGNGFSTFWMGSSFFFELRLPPRGRLFVADTSTGTEFGCDVYPLIFTFRELRLGLLDKYMQA